VVLGDVQVVVAGSSGSVVTIAGGGGGNGVVLLFRVVVRPGRDVVSPGVDNGGTVKRRPWAAGPGDLPTGRGRYQHLRHGLAGAFPDRGVDLGRGFDRRGAT